MAEPFLAEVRIWACSFPPRSWAECNGQLLDINENSALFSLMGITYGGDGRTTFGLPNLKGRAPMGWGDGPALTPRFYGEYGGYPSIVLNESQIPSHDHILTGVRDSGTSGTPASDLFMGTDRGTAGDNIKYLDLKDDVVIDTQMSPLALSASGGSEAHENRQPYLTMNFCIAFDGIYPPRN